MTPLELRLHLHRNGYAPLPLIGKAPVLKNWQQKTDSNEGEIELWSSIYSGATNTGALTEKMPTADIDIQNEAVFLMVRANDLLGGAGGFLVQDIEVERWHQARQRAGIGRAGIDRRQERDFFLVSFDFLLPIFEDGYFADQRQRSIAVAVQV